MIKEFINSYGLGILSTILTAIIGFLGMKIKAFLDERSENEFIEKAVEKTVKAVEQMYHSYAGAEKFKIALANITEMLEVKGIAVTELELKLMIESVVAEFNKPWIKEGEDDDN